MSSLMTPTYQTGFYAPGRGGVPKHKSLWRGCVSAWAPLLGNTGLTLRDQSTYGNHGTLTNGPTWFPSQGKYALSFDAVDDYVLSSRPAVSTLPFTLCAWVMQTDATKTVYAVSMADAATPNAYYAVAVNTGAKAISPNGDANGTSLAVSSVSLALNTWYHIAGIWTSSTDRKVYVNGVLEGSDTASRPTDNSLLDNTAIGALKRSSVTAGGGMVDDARIYNRALNTSELKQLASRPGIAYELAPRKVYSIPAAVGTRQYKLLRPSILRGA